MSELLDTQEQVRIAQASIARLESELVRAPSSRLLLASLRSWSKRKTKFELQFEALAKADRQQVLRYRVFDQDHGQEPNLPLIAPSLIGLQSMLSVLFESKRSDTPRNSTRISDEGHRRTDLRPAFLFSGSIGFAFTLDKAGQEDLFSDVQLDSAIASMIELLNCKTSGQVLALADRIGRAPVKIAYQWLKEHISENAGVEIDWRGLESDTPSRKYFLMDSDQMQLLRDAIDASEETSREQLTFDGQMLMADARTGRFLIERDDETLIKGRISESLLLERNTSFTVPRRCSATVIATTKFSYALGEEKTSYQLIKFTQTT